MRNLTLVLNSLVVVFFAGFLAYTFFARQHIEGLARGFVTEITVQHSGAIVDIADESLNNPLVKKLLSAEQTAALRDEITEYRSDPAAYISDVTRQDAGDLRPENANPVLHRVASVKESVRTFYDDTLIALIDDLRIFSASNLIAGVIAFALAYLSTPNIRRSIVWFSFLMFVAVLYCSFLYVNDMTFFRILFRSHMGWWYPVFLCAMVVALFLDYQRNPTSQNKSPRKRAG